MTADPVEAVDAANRAYGTHPGYRALHAKGVVLKGTFTATPEAAELTRAAHMQGGAVPATFRFSNGSGNPREPDGAPGPRGLAVKCYLPDGSRSDIVAISTPVFPTRTPEAFLELIEVQGAGLGAAWKLPRFLAHHTETLRALPQLLPALRPPASYATVPYHGIHAFKWIDAAGGERHVRYALIPEAPVERLAPWQTRGRGHDYLTDEIYERIGRGPVRFTLELQLAAADDPLEDPSVAWPAGRRRVRAGGFEISAPETERETRGDVLVFDPTRVTDGIELSDDPVLRFRPLAYAESIARRTSSPGR
jgi:catalase